MVTPVVSVIMPCRNEGRRLMATLDDLAAQDLAEPFEVVVADGSVDGTRALLEARIAAATDRFALRLVPNPEATIPQALNRGVQAAAATWIVRVDAHARIAPDYLRLMLAHLREGGLEVVGPRMSAMPGADGMVARVIAWCQNHPLGNGGTPARNRLAGPRRVVHTPMSCYHRRVWERVGGYDNSLLANEDFDFDWRCHASGIAVWSVPSPVYRIVARSTIWGLAQQRWRYGRWKGAVIRRHPGSVQTRQLLPQIGLLLLVGVMVAVAVHPEMWIILVLPLLGLMAVVLAVATSGRGQDGGAAPSILLAAPVACLVMPVIHICWAAGSWYGLARGAPPAQLPSMALDPPAGGG